MAKNRFYKVDEMFEMVSWALCEEKILINLLIEYRNNGKLFDSGCQRDALIEITSRLSNALGKTIALEKVVKKFNALRTRHELWDVVQAWPGVDIIVSKNKFVADETTWDAIIKEHPSAKKYKHQPENLWVEMECIFGGLKMDEETRKIKELIHGLMKPDTPPDIVIINDDEDHDVDTGVKDEQSVAGGVRHILPVSTPSIYHPSFGIEKGFGVTSHVGMKMARFDDDYGSEFSQFSSTGSCMWP